MLKKILRTHTELEQTNKDRKPGLKSSKDMNVYFTKNAKIIRLQKMQIKITVN